MSILNQDDCSQPSQSESFKTKPKYVIIQFNEKYLFKELNWLPERDRRTNYRVFFHLQIYWLIRIIMQKLSKSKIWAVKIFYWRFLRARWSVQNKNNEEPQSSKVSSIFFSEGIKNFAKVLKFLNIGLKKLQRSPRFEVGTFVLCLGDCYVLQRLLSLNRAFWMKSAWKG